MGGGGELSHSIPQICIARLQTSIWAARPKELAGANSLSRSPASSVDNLGALDRVGRRGRRMSS